MDCKRYFKFASFFQCCDFEAGDIKKDLCCPRGVNDKCSDKVNSFVFNYLVLSPNIVIIASELIIIGVVLYIKEKLDESIPYDVFSYLHHH